MVIVTGANGFVGGRIMRGLVSNSTDVLGLVRAGRSLEDPDWRRRETPDFSEASLREALVGADSVVHAASVVHRPGADEREHRAFNVDGTRALVDAARSTGVRRIVFLSTIKVYGEEPTGTIDEDTPVDRTSPYSSTKLDAERIVLDAEKDGGPSAVVLRLCPVYGEGDKGNVRRVITAVARGRFVVPGRGATRKSVVHASIVADAVARAVRGDARGVFVVADRVAPSMRELGDAVALALGRRRPPSVPVAAVMAAAALAEGVARLRGRVPNVSRELVRKSLRPTICSPAKLERALGMEAHLELENGIAEEVAWLRVEGLV